MYVCCSYKVLLLFFFKTQVSNAKRKWINCRKPHVLLSLSQVLQYQEELQFLQLSSSNAKSFGNYSAQNLGNIPPCYPSSKIASREVRIS